MPLTPPAARPWLGPDSRNRPWPGHGAMMIRRAEALGDLAAALGSWARLGLAALAWALGAGGAVLVGRGVADGGEGSSSAVGIGLLLAATLLGGVLVATGSALTRATAAWWTLATAVRADGGRVDATTADPDTLRAHEEAVTADRAPGAGELWRPPLLPRTLVVLLLGAAAVVLAVRAVLGYGEASTPYAPDEVRGAWLTEALLALVCLLPALLTASGLRRVHRARMHRVAHDEPASADAAVGALTPAVGSGPIVVGGRAPGQVTPSPADLAWPGPPQVVPDAPAPSASAPGVSAAEASEALAAPAPGAPVASAAPAAVPTDVRPTDVTPTGAAPTVHLSDGRALAPGRTLVGRAPQARAEEEPAALLAVPDERVSKTHLTVTVEPRRVVVVDRGSTNGTVLHLPDGSSRPLTPGEPVEVADGDVVVLGGTTLTVGDTDVEHTVLREPR
ncbi:FHA domain-containing protein [Georgenia satyanarayanai]|uniref:FHA domain-containing protein n=1 Tax=Georgenia satyanarayanai TaxID=860221 RepID=A0A2Y8ZWI2_9MICO|nr:FHA domain-containing protein [Georgenia satyanarayanai]PYG01644.1 FHA domain-containing protein [Georgenia satyanarayanai]SSA36444.1 FHA domain-containing protein [Georgenia satyanarayanai]